MFRAKIVRLRDGRRALVRRAQPADAKSVIAHVNAVAAEGVYLMTEKVARTLREERAVFQKADGKSELFLVALIDAEIVGTADFARGRHAKNRHVGALGIALRPDARGVGLGRAMMTLGMSWARSVGIRKLTLGVFATNTAARALYRRLGFQVEGRLAGQVIIQGRAIDEILMARWIGGGRGLPPRASPRHDRSSKE